MSQLEGTLASPFSRAYLALKNGILLRVSGQENPTDAVGYALLNWGLEERVVEILRIGIALQERRRGLACSVLSLIENDARAEGMNRMILEVSASNESAVHLYQKCGFREIHRRRAYYPDGSDAVVMEKTLQGSREMERNHGDGLHGGPGDTRKIL